MLILKNVYKTVFFLFLLISTPLCIYSGNWSDTFEEGNINAKETKDFLINENILRKKSSSHKSKNKMLTYYLFIEDFADSFIEIPTTNVSIDSTTISSTYLAGRAPVYNKKNQKVGTCSASFLCMQNSDGIYTDISNYLSIDNGLIVTWFTPTTLINLELDSIIHSMVTECIVLASTKVGFNPFYGKTFNMVVSSDDGKIYFKLTQL